MTQRFVVGGGRPAPVRGPPPGPITYLTLGRWGSVMAYSHSTDKHCVKSYRSRLKIWLSAMTGIRPYRPRFANVLVSVGVRMPPGPRQTGLRPPREHMGQNCLMREEACAGLSIRADDALDLGQRVVLG